MHVLCIYIFACDCLQETLHGYFFCEVAKSSALERKNISTCTIKMVINDCLMVYSGENTKMPLRDIPFRIRNSCHSTS